MFPELSLYLAQAQGESPSMLPTLLMFGGIIVVMYFFMIRPQQKRQKEHQNMINSLQKGDKIITSAGIHGTITNVEDTAFIVQIADGVKIKVEKVAISSVPKKSETEAK